MTPTVFLTELWAEVFTHLWQTSLVLLPIFALEPRIRQLSTAWQNRIWHLALLKVLLPANLIHSLLQMAGASLPMLLQGELMIHRYPSASDPRFWLAPLEVIGAATQPYPALAILVYGLSGLWLGGFGFSLLRLIREVRASRNLLEKACGDGSPAHDPVLADLLERCAIPSEATRVTHEVHAPLTAGCLAPRILVPPALVDGLPGDELAAILRHEDGHRQRRDPLREVGYHFLSALLFFFPLLSPVLRRLRECAEFACDDRALQGMNDPHLYARALAGSVMVGLAPRGLATAMAGGGPSLLRRRLNRLHNPGRRPSMLKNRLALGAVLALLIVGTALPVALAADPPPPPPPPKAPADAKPVPKPSEAPEAPVDNKVTAPKVMEMAPPVYPPEAIKDKVEGTVVVGVVVDSDGSVVSVKAMSGPKVLVPAAVEAVSKATFAPGTYQGKPAKAEVALPIKFLLD